LLICTEKAEEVKRRAGGGGTRFGVPGLDLKRVDNLFEAFCTTKGPRHGHRFWPSAALSSKRHGGRLWASANVPCGAHLSIRIARPHGPSIVMGAETITRRLMPGLNPGSGACFATRGHVRDGSLTTGSGRQQPQLRRCVLPCTSASTAYPRSAGVPWRKTSVSGSAKKSLVWESWKTLVSVWAYHSFSGEVEASNTPHDRPSLSPHAVTNFRATAPRWSSAHE